MIKAIFRLLRLPNLLMIVVTQYFVYYFLLIPNVNIPTGTSFLSPLNFGLLVLSTVFIASAGYIINDYFDLRADRINRPSKMTIGRFIPRRIAILLHWILNILGVLIGLYLAYVLKEWKLGILNLFVSITLWYYSTTFKKDVLTGNLIISFLTAMIIITVWLFEFYAVKNSIDSIKDMLVVFRSVIFPYALFAFLLSLIREVIKDTEDIEGDEKIFCRTFPIVYGIEKTKKLIIAISIVTLLILAYLIFLLYSNSLKTISIYLIIAVALPIIYMIFKVNKAEQKEDFSYLSTMTKIIMLAGILSMQILKF